MSIMSGAARASAGVIALIAWIGLAVQFKASLSQVGSVPETLWVLVRYFTIVANGLVAVVFTGTALGFSRVSSPSRLGGVTLVIMLVGVVYVLLLRGLFEFTGAAKLADILTHMVTPVLVPAFWLFLAPKGGLDRRDPWLWAIIPVVYFAYALLRGALEGIYAYPFMDVGRIGWLRTATTAVAMALGFLLTGFALLWLDQRLSRRPGAR